MDEVAAAVIGAVVDHRKAAEMTTVAEAAVAAVAADRVAVTIETSAKVRDKTVVAAVKARVAVAKAAAIDMAAHGATTATSSRNNFREISLSPYSPLVKVSPSSPSRLKQAAAPTRSSTSHVSSSTTETATA